MELTHVRATRVYEKDSKSKKASKDLSLGHHTQGAQTASSKVVVPLPSLSLQV